MKMKEIKLRGEGRVSLDRPGSVNTFYLQEPTHFCKNWDVILTKDTFRNMSKRNI